MKNLFVGIDISKEKLNFCYQKYIFYAKPAQGTIWLRNDGRLF